VVHDVGDAAGGGGSVSEPPEGGRIYVEIPIERTSARALRIRIDALGRVPEGWPSAGETAWSYVDEIIVR